MTKLSLMGVIFSGLLHGAVGVYVGGVTIHEPRFLKGVDHPKRPTIAVVFQEDETPVTKAPPRPTVVKNPIKTPCHEKPFEKKKPSVQDPRHALQEASKIKQRPLQESGTPRPIYAPKPIYPTLAKRRGWQGTVRLALTVAPSGQVMKTTILEPSSHDQLDQAAVRALGRWRFPPRVGMHGPQTYHIPIVFSLKNKGGR